MLRPPTYKIKYLNSPNLVERQETKLADIFHLKNLPINLNVYIADNKIVEDWKSGDHMRRIANLREKGEFILRWMHLMNTTDSNQPSSSYLKHFLSINQPTEYNLNRRAHVDTTSLEHKSPPPSLTSHKKINPNDKSIWDRAYLHEYLGLHEDVEVWEYISEQEYHHLRPIVGNSLPFMVVALD